VRIGSTIGQYRVLRKIGEGGMGVVFVGEHVVIGRQAAIKILKPELSKNRGSVERFFNEARATAAIQDPGIVQLFDVGVARDRSAYIAMELLDGESVDMRLRRVGTLSPAGALRLVTQAARTLSAVHARGIIHRDIKPGNLFLVRDPQSPDGERVMVLDFGTAKLDPHLGDGAQTHSGVILGTPIYMSPEQCSGTAVDERADIYSLGCVLFRLLTGRPPFAVTGTGPAIAAHLTEQPLPPSRFAHVPPGIDEIVLRCLAKSRADRFPTMDALAVECDRQFVALTGDTAAAIVLPDPLANLPDPTTVSLDDPATTLGGAVDEPPRSPTRSRIGAAVAVAVIAVSVVAIALARRGGDDTTTSAALPAPPPVSAPPVDAPLATPAATPTAVVDARPPPVPAHVDPPLPAHVDPPATPKPRPRPTEPRDLYENRN